MRQYRVIWEIDIDADSPREAAEKAREIQRDAGSVATVFTVRKGKRRKGAAVVVDLEVAEADEEQPTVRPGGGTRA